MHIGFWIAVAAAAWFGAEFGISRRSLRVSVQLCVLAACVISAFFFGRFTGRINPTIQGNMLIKNLTQSLVPILNDAEGNETELRTRLEELDRGVRPTYESFDESKQAVENFLNSYGIKFNSRISMHESDPKPTKGEEDIVLEKLPSEPE